MTEKEALTGPPLDQTVKNQRPETLLQEAANTDAPVPIEPKVLEWARAQFTEDDFESGYSDIQENGGFLFKDFIQKLTGIVRPDERNNEQ